MVQTQARYLALGARFGVFLVPQRRLLRLPGVAIWDIFEVLDGLMTCSSYQVEATTKIKSYIHLGTYPGKVVSAGGTVWSIPWPSTVPITAPGGRDLGYFRGSGRGGDM